MFFFVCLEKNEKKFLSYIIELHAIKDENQISCDIFFIPMSQKGKKICIYIVNRDKKILPEAVSVILCKTNKEKHI